MQEMTYLLLLAAAKCFLLLSVVGLKIFCSHFGRPTIRLAFEFVPDPQVIRRAYFINIFYFFLGFIAYFLRCGLAARRHL